MILHQHDLTLRAITGADELDLFNSLVFSSRNQAVTRSRELGLLDG